MGARRVASFLFSRRGCRQYAVERGLHSDFSGKRYSGIGNPDCRRDLAAFLANGESLSWEHPQFFRVGTILRDCGYYRPALCGYFEGHFHDSGFATLACQYGEAFGQEAKVVFSGFRTFSCTALRWQLRCPPYPSQIGKFLGGVCPGVCVAECREIGGTGIFLGDPFGGRSGFILAT